jgi:hypothetical protein
MTSVTIAYRKRGQGRLALKISYLSYRAGETPDPTGCESPPPKEIGQPKMMGYILIGIDPVV